MRRADPATARPVRYSLRMMLLERSVIVPGSQLWQPMVNRLSTGPMKTKR